MAWTHESSVPLAAFTLRTACVHPSDRHERNRTRVLDGERMFVVRSRRHGATDVGTAQLRRLPRRSRHRRSRDATFCVLDLETTGGNRNDDMITEIGVVKVRGGECLGTFHTLVNPGRAIPPQITVLTGLTDAVVATAPRIETVLGTLRRLPRRRRVRRPQRLVRPRLPAGGARPRPAPRLPPDGRRHRRPRPPAAPRRRAQLPALHARRSTPARPQADPPRARRRARHHRSAAPS